MCKVFVTGEQLKQPFAMTDQTDLPVLYSLQYCPYAMRARLGILLAHQPVMLRAVRMRKLPDELLTASPKATLCRY